MPVAGNPQEPLSPRSNEPPLVSCRREKGAAGPLLTDGPTAHKKRRPAWGDWRLIGVAETMSLQVVVSHDEPPVIERLKNTREPGRASSLPSFDGYVLVWAVDTIVTLWLQREDTHKARGDIPRILKKTFAGA